MSRYLARLLSRKYQYNRKTRSYHCSRRLFTQGRRPGNLSTGAKVNKYKGVLCCCCCFLGALILCDLIYAKFWSRNLLSAFVLSVVSATVIDPLLRGSYPKRHPASQPPPNPPAPPHPPTETVPTAKQVVQMFRWLTFTWFWVSWCFEPSQALGILSGLTLTWKLDKMLVMSLKYIQVTQSILCLIFLMYVAAIKHSNYSGQKESLEQPYLQLMILTHLWPWNNVKMIKPEMKW